MSLHVLRLKTTQVFTMAPAVVKTRVICLHEYCGNAKQGIGCCLTFIVVSRLWPHWAAVKFTNYICRLIFVVESTDGGSAHTFTKHCSFHADLIHHWWNNESRENAGVIADTWYTQVVATHRSMCATGSEWKSNRKILNEWSRTRQYLIKSIQQHLTFLTDFKPQKQDFFSLSPPWNATGKLKKQVRTQEEQG